MHYSGVGSRARRRAGRVRCAGRTAPARNVPCLFFLSRAIQVIEFACKEQKIVRRPRPAERRATPKLTVPIRASFKWTQYSTPGAPGAVQSTRVSSHHEFGIVALKLPLHHRARQAQMTNGPYRRLDEIWGSGQRRIPICRAPLPLAQGPCAAHSPSLTSSVHIAIIRLRCAAASPLSWSAQCRSA